MEQHACSYGDIATSMSVEFDGQQTAFNDGRNYHLRNYVAHPLLLCTTMGLVALRHQSFIKICFKNVDTTDVTNTCTMRDVLLSKR